jgi:heme-degrading monooxygenase HmoA
MFLRFIRLVVREGSEPEFQRFYSERVIPALSAVPGCLFAGLLAPWRSEEHRSLTLWRSPEAARAYEESGLYHQLLDESKPYLSSRTVWRVRLAEDPLETIDPGRKEIPPEGYELAGDERSGELEEMARPVFLRIVALRAGAGRREELAALYRDLVLPTLRETPGCLGALLASGSNDPNELLSITVWDREESATRYEMSGVFERLTRRLAPTFSPLSQWQLTLGDAGPERRAAPGVTSYHLVGGKRLDREEKPG